MGILSMVERDCEMCNGTALVDVLDYNGEQVRRYAVHAVTAG